jgi:serine/threonine-protein kinase HipA
LPPRLLALRQFFDYLVLSILLRNGDAHLKNFGVLYDETGPDQALQVWLSPLYDQVTTTLYTYERPGGIETVDHTMALKLRRGQRSGDKSPARGYPLRKELEKFGRDVCGVPNPSTVIERVMDAQSKALQLASSEASIPRALLRQMETIWDGAREM